MTYFVLACKHHRKLIIFFYFHMLVICNNLSIGGRGVLDGRAGAKVAPKSEKKYGTLK